MKTLFLKGLRKKDRKEEFQADIDWQADYDLKENLSRLLVSLEELCVRRYYREKIVGK